MQDLLAMTTLQFAVQSGGDKKPEPTSSIDDSFEQDLNRILEKINAQLA